MTELIVFRFGTPNGAKNFLHDLLPLHEEHVVRIEDAVIAVKDADGRLFGNNRLDLASRGFVSGTLWGTLTGALFFEPILGFIIGGLAGLLTGGLASLATNGVQDNMVRRLAQRALEPNNSAVFLLISKLTPDKFAARLARHDATLITTSLSFQQERELRQAWRRVDEDGPLALHEPARSDYRTQLLPAQPR